MKNEHKELWRSIAAYVYITICAFDFLFMPFYTNRINQHFIEDTVQELDPENRVYILEIMDKVSVEEWTPVTTQGTGGFVFHISFGLILGGSAIGSRSWTISPNSISSSPPKNKDKDNDHGK